MVTEYYSSDSFINDSSNISSNKEEIFIKKYKYKKYFVDLNSSSNSDFDFTEPAPIIKKIKTKKIVKPAITPTIIPVVAPPQPIDPIDKLIPLIK